MEAITITTTLWKILKESKIVIPIFQRDYAQGRSGKEDLRKRFLNEIKSSLESNSELLLDFVYGTKKEDVIYPLDGQQRLTTLWVLMWYAIFMSSNNDNADKDKRKEWLRWLSNFTYETRPSSKNFIEWLCSEELLNKTPKPSCYLSDFIQNQTGFYSGWKQDPTVQSILRILSGTQVLNKKTRKIETPYKDGIEQIFKEFDKDNFKILFEEDRCPIRFYHLNLLGIKQPDNLYVKMNARGEQLTGFENFKADLVGYLSKNEELKSFVTLGNDKYILDKWDVSWTDLFWKEKGNADSVDDLFFTFIKRFLLNRYITENDNAKRDKNKDDVVYKMLYDNEQKEYTSFELYENLIDESCINDLVVVLDNALNLKFELPDNIDGGASEKLDNALNLKFELPLLKTKEYTFFPQYDDKGNVKSATFQDRVIMYGICLYLQKVKNKDYFHQWLRVLSNLSYYNEIPSFKEYEIKLKFIELIVDNLNGNLKDVDVYSDISALKELAENGDTENHKQLKEEIEKIKKIQNNDDIENVLKKLESLWIFSGRIDCLLDDDLLNEKTRDFLEKQMGKSSRYLSDNDNLTILFQAILAKTGTEKLMSGLKINDEHDNFRKILNGELKEYFQAVLKDVLNEESCQEIDQALEKIINDYTYKDNDWKYALIKDKSLWKYSLGKFGKHFNDENEYYLYKRTNRNEADIPLKAYSKFIKELEDKNGFPINIEYKKEKGEGYWNVYYKNEAVKFQPNNGNKNNHSTTNDEVST